MRSSVLAPLFLSLSLLCVAYGISGEYKDIGYLTVAFCRLPQRILSLTCRLGVALHLCVLDEHVYGNLFDHIPAALPAADPQGPILRMWTLTSCMACSPMAVRKPAGHSNAPSRMALPLPESVDLLLLSEQFSSEGYFEFLVSGDSITGKGWSRLSSGVTNEFAWDIVYQNTTTVRCDRICPRTHLKTHLQLDACLSDAPNHDPRDLPVRLVNVSPPSTFGWYPMSQYTMQSVPHRAGQI